MISVDDFFPKHFQQEEFSKFIKLFSSHKNRHFDWDWFVWDIWEVGGVGRFAIMATQTERPEMEKNLFKDQVFKWHCSVAEQEQQSSIQ